MVAPLSTIFQECRAACQRFLSRPKILRRNCRKSNQKATPGSFLALWSILFADKDVSNISHLTCTTRITSLSFSKPSLSVPSALGILATTTRAALVTHATISHYR